MTRSSWFSGRSESSRKFMGRSFARDWRSSVGAVADDAGALHLADRRPVVLDRVVLRGAVVPDGDAVGPPAPTHLVFGDGRPADQVSEQVRRARREVGAVPDVGGRVEIGEVGG